MRNITLCADDFGLDAEVSSGILELVENKRITAVSCLTTFPAWETWGRTLAEYRGQIDIGLHFNLSEGPAMTEIRHLTHSRQFFSLRNIIVKAYSHQLSQKSIEEELDKQLAAFVKVCGFLPDFIDGHQHIHQLPTIREAIINIYLQHYIDRKAYIRIPSNGLFNTLTKNISLKSLLIAGLGANKLLKHLKKNKIPHNQSFSGIYNFANATQYRNHFNRFLKNISNNGLIMCHPGKSSSFAVHKNKHPELTMQKARICEYQYLLSEDFVMDCQMAGINLSRFDPSF